MRYRSQGRHTAKRAVLEVCLTMRMVVVFMVKRSAAGVSRAELDQKWRATRRHEAHRDIGTKNKRGQQQDAQSIGSPSVTEPSVHMQAVRCHSACCSSSRLPQLRHKSSGKPEKDLRQAANLIEALVERYPGAIEDAASAVPKSAARHLARAIKALEQHLPPTAMLAWDILQAITLAG